MDIVQVDLSIPVEDVREGEHLTITIEGDVDAKGCLTNHATTVDRPDAEAEMVATPGGEGEKAESGKARRTR